MVTFRVISDALEVLLRLLFVLAILRKHLNMMNYVSDLEVYTCTNTRISKAVL